MIALLALLTPDAAACGGFFCNNLDPVEQAGESVVFEVNPMTDKTTMHVQVTYTGPAAEFAWIVPVNGEPDLFVSNDALFNTLQRMTEPRFDLWWDVEGECSDWFWAEDDALANSNGGIPGPPETGGVNVISQQQVGPYDTVVLSAESSEALLTWLQANDYQVPNALDPVLAPYVSQRHNFVALRLTSGNDVGDLVPLGMRYDGLTPAIPIQLTSVAATPDMPLTTYLLGPSRAVPTNYLHVELNDAALDWFDAGSNYREVLSRAADEAGGHAFATDSAMQTEGMRGMLYDPSWEELALEESVDAVDFLGRILGSGIPASSTILEVFQTHIPVPSGFDEQAVYNCPQCYASELTTWVPDFDAAAAADEMHERVITPLEQIDGMFQRADVLTRLTSTLDAEEMTLDPEFGFNALMEQEVPSWHTARLVYQCEDSADFYGSSKLLVLEDGTEIKIPSDEWLEEHGMTNSDYLAGLQEPAAVRIESTDEYGMPVVIFDGRGLVDELIENHNADTDRLEGRGVCGCSSLSSALSSAWLLGLAPLLLRRRR